MSKYLFLKLGALGDLSFFMPAVDQVHLQDPQAEITWIVGTAYAPLLEQNPRIHRVIRVNETKLLSQSGGGQIGLLNRIQRLSQCMAEILILWAKLDFRYDQIWIGHRTLGALLLLRFRVLGQFFQLVRTTSQTSILRAMRNEIVTPALTLHESRAIQLLAEKAFHKKISPESWKADYSWVPSAPQGYSLPPRYIAIHLGGGQNGKTEFTLKQWPHWSEFLLKLVKQTSDLIVLVGSPSEMELADKILLQPEFKSKAVSFVGKTNFLELLGILKGATQFVGVDSGPLHFADSFNIPCLGLYGPTSPASWGLLGAKSRVITEPVTCSPCYRDDGYFPDCAHQIKCMTGLSADRVLEEFRI